MAKPITQQAWESFQRARQFTGARYQNSLGKGFLARFAPMLKEEHKDRVRYLDRTGSAFDVREYIEGELVEK